MVAAMQATQFLIYAYPHLTLIGRQQSSPLHVAVLTVDKLIHSAIAAGLRMNKAHVTHPELKTTFNLEIIGVK